jgi:ABC-type multidrug transport system ATPase subunit
MEPSQLLSAKRINMSYGSRHVLEDVSFSIAPGECVALVGENGAGKSTLLRILVGLLRPVSGEINLQGRIGYCPQEPLVFDGLTMDENIEYFAAAYGLPSSQWRADLDSLAVQLNFSRDRRQLAGILSGGTRQKLNLAVALLARPDIVILDEPYAGFDWETYLRFWDIAAEYRKRGRGILIVSHLVHERHRFDRLLELRETRLQQLGEAS